MTTNNYDILLRFILDQSSQQKTKAGVDALTGDLSDVDKIVRAANQDFEKLEKQIKEASSVKEFERLERQLKGVEDQVKDTTNAYRQQARVLRAEAAAITDDFAKARVAQIRSISERIGGASRTGLAVSGVVVGGILAEANRYAKEAEGAGKATAATREWTRATEELAAARARVDTVLLRESLPLLQQAAKIATQASRFVERNPEIVQAALKVGVVVAGLSAVGLAVSKGIRLYADVQALALGAQELAAAKLQDIAADKQLIAARLRAGTAGIPIPAGGAAAAGTTGGLVAAATSVGLIVAGVIAAKYAVDLTNIVLEKTGIARDIADAQRTIQETSKRPYPGIITGARQTAGTASGASLGVASMASLGGDLATSSHRDAVVSAFAKWQDEEAEIIREAAEQRIKIVANSEKQIASETAKYNKQVTSINSSARKREESITSSFLKESARAEADYQERRAQIIRDGGESIRDIEEAHQERLRKMTQDHDERVQELTASRDALGLAKEARRFNQGQDEENRNTRLEIAKRRQDLAERLAELDREHKIEQAQRLAQFQEALAENEAQRKEQLKEAAAAHAEEMSQIRAQRAQQLRELQEGLNAERLRRREVFIAQIRDLDAALLGERSLKSRYYNLMLADAERFLAAYRATQARIAAATPTHDFTGYAYTGMYRMAANGQPEYVLSGAATKAAENIIGGRLTQDSLLSALLSGAGRQSRSLTINDHSRFDGRISASQVRAIKQETIGAIARELG